ncbi:MAG: L-seryl-tRNA(Sec) selenium transferase [Gemmataceae bacterium]|nr:L-seryl-tRNA(Sec) selenium transferase [Gemmataceae bacterium]
MSDNPYRNLPSVNDVVQSPPLASLVSEYGQDVVTHAARDAIAAWRKRLANGESQATNADSLASEAAVSLSHELRPRLRRVINATGIVLHTNLGRAPMAETAAKAAYDAARGYLNLELDLETGKRSSRQSPIREWVCRITGAEAATAVNNNAAATVIALRALCQGKEVIVSRGQLIEIGGSFRIPDIMAVSGAKLVEVGTTNITRIADFERAITENTAALMQIHTSNYRISGFSKSVSLAELVGLGKAKGLRVIDDVGSGALVDFRRFGFEGEPIARDSIAAGADLVLFSGDKLLGGPQAGILAGKKEWIQRIEKDPMMRAFRLDKMTLAALEATLRLYLREETALAEVPTLSMLGTPLDTLRTRAEELATALRGAPGLAGVETMQDVAFVGGGSLPDQQMPTWVVAVRPANISDDEFSRRLRAGNPAVMGRVREGQVLFDVRTVFPEQMSDLAAAIRTGANPS